MTHTKNVLLIFGLMISTICTAQYDIMIVETPSNGDCTGELAINSVGPLTELSFLWSTGATTNSINQLCGDVYYVTITSTDGCETVLKKALSSTSGCTELDSEDFDASIKPSCPSKTDGEIEILKSGPYSYLWDSKETTSTIGNLTPGDYCVTISLVSDPKCHFTNCYVVPELNNCNQQTSQVIKETPVLMVNEVSNGLSTGKEFIELVVVRKKNDCRPVDLRGYIIDDNNGDFSVDVQGGASGITPGHFRFSSSTAWQSVPVGSIILIYNGDDKNPAIQVADDPTDADNDDVYVLPSSSDLIVGNSKNPSSNNNSYDPKEPEIASWLSLSMYDKGDAIQVRTPEGKFMHGISFGSNLRINGGPDDLHLSTLSGKGKGYGFTSGGIRNSSNYFSYETSEGKETPGLPNNNANASFISSLCGSTSGGGKPKEAFSSPLRDISAFPNPFRNQLSVSASFEEEVQILFELKDVVGTPVQGWTVDVDKGGNDILLSMGDKKLPAGLYTLTGTTQKSVIIFSTKVVKL